MDIYSTELPLDMTDVGEILYPMVGAPIIVSTLFGWFQKDVEIEDIDPSNKVAYWF